MTGLRLDFLSTAGRKFNQGQCRVLALGGNIHDVFPFSHSHRSPDASDTEWLVLTQLLQQTWSVPGRMVLTYELNGPIRFMADSDQQRMRDAWQQWRTGRDAGDAALAKLVAKYDGGPRSDLVSAAEQFDRYLQESIGRPAQALELLRQMCCCSRQVLQNDLIIIIEAADLLVPDAPVTQLADSDRHRLQVCEDWFADPAFMSADDVVVMLCDHPAAINQRLMRLPSSDRLLIPAPDAELRREFLHHALSSNVLMHSSNSALPEGETEPTESVEIADAWVRSSAGLSLQVLQRCCQAHGADLSVADISAAVESHVVTQLGEGVVGFSRPQQSLSRT